MSFGDDEYYALEIEDVEKDTGKALLVVVDASDVTCEMIGADRKVWIASSQIVESSEVTGEGDSGELHITMWLAKEKGWF